MTRLQKMTLIMLMKRFTASHANMLSGTSNAFSLRALRGEDPGSVLGPKDSGLGAQGMGLGIRAQG